MTKFLVLYESPVTAQARMDDAGMEKMQASMKEWMDWKERNGDALVDFGSPVKADKHLETGEVSASSSKVTGFSIIQADSLEKATEIMKDHPNFKRDDMSMELIEFVTMPGM